MSVDKIRGVLLYFLCGGYRGPQCALISHLHVAWHVTMAWKRRGSPCSFPEETLEGYQHAIDAGADYIEMDVVSRPLQPHLRWLGARVSAQPEC